MAGANWHEVVFNAEAEIVRELFSPGGVEIHFQKNWCNGICFDHVDWAFRAFLCNPFCQI
jgi:hypothetical protein